MSSTPEREAPHTPASTTTSPAARPAARRSRQRFPGHAPVRHGEGDWRCKCGVPLNSWRYAGGIEGPHVAWTGRAAARDMMRYHRADLAHPELVMTLRGTGKLAQNPVAVANGPAPPAAADVLEAGVVHLARLALDFGTIARTACYHPDRLTRESDATHTVMLGWIAPGLAHRLYPDELDAGLVAQYALVHDMVEVYAGDTPTLRIGAHGRRAKARREHAAARRIAAELGEALPWVAELLTRYERQVEPEARFTRAADKILPMLVHCLDGAHGLIEENISPAELRGLYTRQSADVARYAGEFTALMLLRDALADRAVAVLTTATEVGPRDPVPPARAASARRCSLRGG
jgi:putative hydrolases of HD superfamily